MKEYIRPNEAFMMLDKNKIREWGKKYGHGNLSTWTRHYFNRTIWEGYVFYIVSGSSILLQKDSVLIAFSDLLKEEYCDGKTEQKLPSRYSEEPHVCSLEIEIFKNTNAGNMLIDGIFCDYHLEPYYLKESLEREGVFPMLNCTCGYIGCGGRYVEVRHISEDKLAWVMFYHQETEPIKSLNGFLVKDNDYQEYININKYSDKAEKESGKGAYYRASEIINSSKEVFIPLPLLFSRTQLEELVKE